MKRCRCTERLFYLGGSLEGSQNRAILLWHTKTTTSPKSSNTLMAETSKSNKGTTNPLMLHVVLLGVPGTGKSCLAIRFIANRFLEGKFGIHASHLEDYDPTLEDFYRKPVDLDGRVTILDIFDTAGWSDVSVGDSYVRR